MSKGIDNKETRVTTQSGGGTQSCAPTGCPLLDVQGLCEKDKYDCDGTKWKCDIPRNHSAK